MRIIVTSETPNKGSNENSNNSNNSTTSQTPNRNANGDQDSGTRPTSSSKEEGIQPHDHSKNGVKLNESTSSQNIEMKKSDGTSAKRKMKKTKKLKSEHGGKMEDDECNSGDEHVYPAASKAPTSLEELKQQVTKQLVINQEEFKKFEEVLKREKGFVIKKMGEDGNCLFRAVADQIYGDQDMHDQVRERCMSYMQAERDHYSQFITEDFGEYIARKKRDKCYGNNLEIQAMGELYNRPIEIYTYQHDNLQLQPINIFHNQYQTDNPPIRVSYHNGNHYNSVIDPSHPTVGVGLGLPNLQPGLADKLQVQEAVKQSEADELEKLIMQQYQKETEMNADDDIAQAILLQSQQEFEDKMLQKSIEESRKTFFESILGPTGKSEL